MKNTTRWNLLSMLSCVVVTAWLVIALPGSPGADSAAQTASPMATAASHDDHAAPAFAWPYPAPRVDASAPPVEQPPTF